MRVAKMFVCPEEKRSFLVIAVSLRAMEREGGGGTES